ncbi:MAG: hypothetical protein RLZZ623_79 [Actinomycetota bacterium]|jgi:hypothetical protein
MMFFAHCRSFLARHRSVYWLAVSAVSLILGALAVGEQRSLDRARRAWTTTEVVWVASAPMVPGDPLVVRRVELPHAAIPDDVLVHDASDTAPLVALRPLHRNEIVTADDVGDSTKVLAGESNRIVAIPVGADTPAVSVGDRVDVVAAGNVVAADGLVVATSDSANSVAVASEVAALAASAAHDGTATLVVRPL